MGIFTLVLAILWVVKTFLLPSGLRRSLSPGQQVSIDLITLLLAIPAVYYSWRFFALVRQKLLWKIRRRLILAHIFIGLIPVLVVVAILYVSALLVYYQLSYYLIMNQLGIHIAQLHALNLMFAEGIAGTGAQARAGFPELIEREGKYLFSAFPGAAVILKAEAKGSAGTAVLASRNVKEESLGAYQVPAWTNGREFSGLVVEDFAPELYRAAGASRGRLFLRSLVPGDLPRGGSFSLEISVPLDQYLLDRIKAALGLDLLVADHVGVSGLNVMLQNTQILKQNILSSTSDLGRDETQLGRPVWSILLVPTSWSSGEEQIRTDTEVLFVELSSSKLLQNVFRSESNVGRTILDVLKLVLGFFLVVEIVSLVIGILLTKSITNAVHNLDRGTQFIKRGDFSHRVVVRSNDQLGALARSFNQMTEYVQSLVKERVLKERLERELEIAREVQEQLFPRQAPRMDRMELTGLCLPARVVSGDYYDFLQLDPRAMGMALSDICGKGISAALLMANLQATLRSNVINLSRGASNGFERVLERGAVAQVVKMLNDQIYTYTASNKFASFFYAVYDDRSLELTYCNAGHNPPLYFTNGSYKRLETGGTVVGIFPDACYEEERLNLRPGDLFLGYTDGIVECVNEYGEEFGEQRLVDLIQQNSDRSADDIQKVIVERVLDWAYEEERDDDMTILVAKIVR
jgi:sigma-B regulation protein RsbU (phosphoserine phosphatase)